MPWTAEDMAKKGAKDPARAAEIANDVLAKCTARGGRDCEGAAIHTALTVVNFPRREN